MKSERLQRPDKGSKKESDDNALDKNSKEFKKITRGESLSSQKWKKDFFIKVNG
jgi:hypothetical protein